MTDLIRIEATHSEFYIYIYAIWQMLLSKATYKEYICVKRDRNIWLWSIRIRIRQVSSIHNYKVNRTSCLHNSRDKRSKVLGVRHLEVSRSSITG